jgi:anthranilate phosphoribosyltransferase
MAEILQGSATPAQAGAFLMGLRSKGETVDEVLGLIDGLRAASVAIRPRRDAVVDLCGTGGDGTGTFNISTAASFVVAGAGVAVAKHGNRAASSRAGSADVLEALGVPIDLPPERARAAIEEHGFAFLFAQLYHPAMKHLAPVRRELGVRTVFNILGPLASPARVDRQLIGVPDRGARGLLAGALRLLGCERAWVVAGHGGIDEVSISGPTDVSIVTREGLEETSISPEDAGIRRGGIDGLRGGSAAENASLIERVLAGESGPARDAVAINAAAALVVAGAAGGLREAAERAGESIDSGAARRVLENVRRFR